MAAVVRKCARVAKGGLGGEKEMPLLQRRTDHAMQTEEFLGTGLCFCRLVMPRNECPIATSRCHSRLSVVYACVVDDVRRTLDELKASDSVQPDAVNTALAPTDPVVFIAVCDGVYRVVDRHTTAAQAAGAPCVQGGPAWPRQLRRVEGLRCDVVTVVHQARCHHRPTTRTTHRYRTTAQQ